MVQPLTRRSFLIFLFILAAYAAVSLYRLDDLPPPWYDEIVHLNTAQHFAGEGRIWCDFYKYKFKEGALFNGMPLHWLLLGCYGKLFGLDFFVSRLLYLLSSCVILLCAYILTGKMLGGKIGIGSSIALAASFVFFHNSRQIMPQVPAATFSILAVFFFYLSTWRGSNWPMVLSGFAGGLAGLSHPTGFIASFAIITLLFRARSKPLSYIVYLFSFFCAMIPYAFYVALNFTEYLNQTKTIVGQVYESRNIILNILDDLPARYLGLPRISSALKVTQVGSGEINSFVYNLLWQIRHLDLRIYVCEIIRGAIFLAPVVYIWLDKKISKNGKDFAIIAALYIALMAAHPNKFGPYTYVLMPYLAACFTIFVNDLLENKKRPVAAGFIITLFIVSNPLFIFKEVSTKKIEPYKPFIGKISSYVKKGSVIAGPIYYWPGLKDDYKFISITVLTYEAEKTLKSINDGVKFKDLPASVRGKIVRDVISKNKIEYVLMTTHPWESITEAAAMMEGLTDAVRRYLFYNSDKVLDLLRSNYYKDLPMAEKFEDEVYDQRKDGPGFRNVNDEYQKSLKIYKLK